MHYCLVSIGSRGDMEPFLAVGELLLKKGHRVSCIFPEQFKTLAEDTNLNFYSLGSDFLDMLYSEAGKNAMGGATNTRQKIIAYVKLAKSYGKINKQLVLDQKKWIDQLTPDVIIYSPKAIYPVLWSIHNEKAIYLSPVPYTNHPTKKHTHIGFNLNLGTLLNLATYALAKFSLVQTIFSTSKHFTDLPTVSRKQISKTIDTNLSIYTLSPSLFQKPTEWPNQAHVVGFHERNKTNHWQPSESLTQFIAKHKKIVFITFGSMTNPYPAAKTELILKTLQTLKIPAIINTFNGGLQKPESYSNEHILFVNQIPYDWVFPKMYAIVHHGGSGTTHMATKYQCPSLIIPHIIDQFMWNKLIAKKQLGPRGIPITKLTEAKFTQALADLYNNPLYYKTAYTIGATMQKKQLADKLYHLLSKSN